MQPPIGAQGFRFTKVMFAPLAADRGAVSQAVGGSMLSMLLAAFWAVHPVLLMQDSLVVERARVGPVSIGAAADSIYSEFRDRARLIDLKLEGHLTPALEIKLFGSQLVGSIVAEIAPANNRLVVTRIHVSDPSLRTKEGIGVGSTYQELRSRYKVDWVGSGEGSFFARVEGLAISFQLDTSGSVALWSIRDPDRIPNGTRIVSIMLTR